MKLTAPEFNKIHDDHLSHKINFYAMKSKMFVPTVLKLWVLLIGIASTSSLLAQETIAGKINDEWFRDIGSKGLKVGDSVPDLEFGTVLNNSSGLKSFSQMKGKLVILDFWNTTCKACIEKFPFMEKLQQEFGSQIQIILVNPFETRKQVESRFSNYRGKKIRLPNLPVIVSDSSYIRNTVIASPMFKLFPHREVPHLVWIDKNGIIRLIGGSESVYPSKISDLINNKEIFVLNNASTTPALTYSDEKPYYKLLGEFKRTEVKFGSFITGYNNELYGIERREFIDSAANQRISQFINQDLLEIYANGPFKDFVTNMNQDIVYAPIRIRWKNFVVFSEDVDTADFVSGSIYSNKDRSDVDIVRSGYCYEQVVPLTTPENQRLACMLNDLNNYFKIQLGVTAHLEERQDSYYALERTSNIDKISTSKRTYLCLRCVIENAIDSSFDLRNKMLQNSIENKPFLIINETGWEIDKEVKVKLAEKGYPTIEKLNNALQEYDLKLVEKQRTSKIIVFRKGEK